MISMTTYYPKINSIWKRDPKGVILPGEYSQPEFEYLEGLKWVWTEKVDGTNIRLSWDGENTRIMGRTDAAQIPAALLPRLVQITDLLPSVFDFGEDATTVTVYGEGYGPKIQGGGKYSPHNDFVLFDVKVGDWWLRRDALVEIAGKLGVGIVPIVAEVPVMDAYSMVANGFKSAWPGVTPEGLVGRPAIELFSRRGERITMKIKTKDLTPTTRKAAESIEVGDQLYDPNDDGWTIHVVAVHEDGGVWWSLSGGTKRGSVTDDPVIGTVGYFLDKLKQGRWSKR